MIDSHERFVLMYDMTIRTARKATEMPPFADIAQALLSRIRAGKSHLVLRAANDGDAAPWLRIKDGAIVDGHSGQHLALLFSVGDPRAANPVFEHSETAELREIEKQEKEGKAVTAHAILSITPHKPNRHRVVVEDIRGLGKTRLRDILGSELRQISDDFGLEYINNTGEPVSTYIVPDLEGYANDKLKTSLNRSTVSGVWLIDTTAKAEFDEVPSARLARREIKFEVHDLPTIQRLKEWGNANRFDRMRLVWNDPEGAGKPERASVDITQNDVAETYFVRQRKIKLERPLAEAVSKLRVDVVRKMIEA